MKISVFIATSVDGFIARKNGDLDWLTHADNAESAEDYGYTEFYSTVDCIVMGRNTMEAAMAFSEWPYADKRVIVLTTTLKEAPTQLAGKVELYSGSVGKLAKRLGAEGCHRLYIDGGKTIQSFINEGLITDLTITRIPVLLGEGLPLFGKTERDLRLNHRETKSYPSGFVKSTYDL